MLHMSPNIVKWHLKRLKAAGRIRRIGSDPKGSWEAVGKPGRKARSEVR